MAAYMFLATCSCAPVCVVCVCNWGLGEGERVRECMCLCLGVYMCVFVFMCVCLCVCVCVCVSARAHLCVRACMHAAGKKDTSGCTTKTKLPEFLGCTSSIVIQRSACTDALADAGPHPLCRYSEPNGFLQSFINALKSLTSFWRSEKSCLGTVS